MELIKDEGSEHYHLMMVTEAELAVLRVAADYLEGHGYDFLDDEVIERVSPLEYNRVIEALEVRA